MLKIGHLLQRKMLIFYHDKMLVKYFYYFIKCSKQDII